MFFLEVAFLLLGLSWGACVFYRRTIHESNIVRRTNSIEFTVTAMLIAAMVTLSLHNGSGWRFALSAGAFSLSLTVVNALPRRIAAFLLDHMPETIGVLSIPFLGDIFGAGAWAVMIFETWNLCLLCAAHVLPGSLFVLQPEAIILFQFGLTILSAISIWIGFITGELDKTKIA